MLVTYAWAGKLEQVVYGLHADSEKTSELATQGTPDSGHQQGLVSVRLSR